MMCELTCVRPQTGTTFPNQTAYIVEQAAALDAKAKASAAGVEAIAPFYGLPVPVKGTVATTDFPSSAGVGVLHDFRAADDAALVTLLRQGHAVIMGKTNVPEFACSWVTANLRGRALNAMDHAPTTGGSSPAAQRRPWQLTSPHSPSPRTPAVRPGTQRYSKGTLATTPLETTSRTPGTPA